MNEEVNERLIELTDEETGEKIVFEYLDTIDYEGVTYFVLTEFFEEEAPEENDVYVMKMITDENGEETLEIEDNDEIVSTIFEIFKEHVGDEFEFLD